MTETNHAREAAASSPSTRDPWNEATPERLDQAARALTYNGSQAEGAAKHLLFVAGHRIESLLRQREQCPPPAEVEKLRHAAREENRLHGHLSNIGSALSEAGHPPTRPRGDELERIRDLAGDRDAWKHKADTLGGELNRIRALVPTASDEQSTFDAVQAYLAKVHKERDASSKALFDVAIALEEADGGRSGTYENGPPRIRAIAAERDTLRQAIGLMTTAKPDMQVDANDPIGMPRQVVELVERLRRDGLTALNSALEQKKRAEAAEALAERNGKAAAERADLLARCGRAVGAKMDDDVPVAIMGRIPAEVERVVAQLRAEVATAKDDVKRLRAEKREEIATAVDHLRRAGIIVGSPTAGPTDGVAISMTLASAVGMLCDERAKILAERDARASLSAEAQTAIAAMRDVGPELAKAGIQVGLRCSHAEAVAQLRGERDRWREKFEAADEESGATAKRILAMCDLLAGAGFEWTGAKSNAAGLHNAVNAALAELARLRKESKRDQVSKQQALLDEIARLFPGKGDLLGRVSKGAALARIGADVANSLPPDAWLEAMRRTEPKRDVALAPIRGLVDEAVRSVFERRSCKEAKVAPATGQPRTEVPLAADGSGTVLNLGEAFRQNLSNAVACLPEGAIDPTTIKIAIRNLHACVAELAKVVERIGAR